MRLREILNKLALENNVLPSANLSKGVASPEDRGILDGENYAVIYILIMCLKSIVSLKIWRPPMLCELTQFKI